MAQFWRALSGNQVGVGAGAPLVNTLTLTDISPAPQVLIPPAFAGQRLRIKAYGIFSTALTPTLLLGGYFGGVAGTLLANTGAVTTGNNAAAWPWDLELEIFIRSIGVTGSAWCNGKVNLGTSLTAMTPLWIPSSQTQPITINTTAAAALTVGAQWGTAAAGNTITCQDAYVETLA